MNGTTYYYVVRAVDDIFREPANSNEAWATPSRALRPGVLGEGCGAGAGTLVALAVLLSGRRLAAVIEFPWPDRAEREAIWRLHVPKQAPLRGEMDFCLLARHDLTGGQIKRAVFAAAAAALRREGPGASIAQEDLEAAAQSVAGRMAAVGFKR